MICCKVIADYNNPHASFKIFCHELGSIGEFLWKDGVMFVGSDKKNVSERLIQKILKKSGYSKFFIEIYDHNNLPIEDDMTNGWITDWIARLSSKEIEEANQKGFKKLSMEMDKLNKEIDAEIQRLSASQAETEGK